MKLTILKLRCLFALILSLLVFAKFGAVAGAGALLILSSWAVTPVGYCMGNNVLGTLSGALILQKALELTFTARPLLKMISMGFRELDGRVDNALLGQTVRSRIQSVATVNNFGTGPTDRADTDVPITLDAMKEIHHQFTPAEYNATDRNLIEESARPIAIGLSNHIIASVAALWVAANFARSITVANGWDYDNTLRALKKDLDDAGVPMANRFAVLNSAVHDSLLGDSMVVSAMNNPANNEAIRTGKLPQVAGLALDLFTALPGNAENLVAFGGTPDSTVYVARAPKNPSEMAPNLPYPGVLDYVEEPRSGFRVMVNQWIDPTTLAVNNRIVWLQGYAKGNPNNGTRVKTA